MSGISFRSCAMVLFVTISLCRVFFLTGCKSQDGIIYKDLEDYQERINEFVYDGYNFDLGKTRYDIIRTLGRPIRITEKEVDNIHDPAQIDNEYIFFYTGLSIRIYEVSRTGKEIVTGMSITSDQYELKWGLSVGCSQDDVKRVLGEPHEKKSNVYVYQTDGAPSSVFFFFRESKVYMVDWGFYYD